MAFQKQKIQFKEKAVGYIKANWARIIGIIWISRQVFLLVGLGVSVLLYPISLSSNDATRLPASPTELYPNTRDVKYLQCDSGDSLKSWVMNGTPFVVQGCCDQNILEASTLFKNGLLGEIFRSSRSSNRVNVKSLNGSGDFTYFSFETAWAAGHKSDMDTRRMSYCLDRRHMSPQYLENRDVEFKYLLERVQNDSYCTIENDYSTADVR